MLEPDIEALRSEAAIRTVVLRYCRAIDRRDFDLLRECYHPDATDEHGSFSGTVDEYIEWVRALLTKYSMTMHFVGNVLVELDGPAAARVETYGIATHRGDPMQPTQNLTTGFRFIDRFERRSPSGGGDGAADWRIARRVATTEWSRVEDPGSWWEPPASFRRGSHDRDDPVFWV
jgi:SnoaL-like domain